MCRRQQQRDQIGRALKQPVEPVIGFQIPPTDTGQPSQSRSRHSTHVLPLRGSVVSRVPGQAPAAGTSPSHHRLHRSPPTNRVIRPTQLRQSLRVIQVAPIKDQLVAQGRCQLIEIGGHESLPFGADHQGMGAFCGLFLRGSEYQPTIGEGLRIKPLSFLGSFGVVGSHAGASRMSSVLGLNASPHRAKRRPAKPLAPPK